MAVIIKKPEVGRYNNADHLAFHKLSDTICKKNSDAINMPPWIMAYGQKVAQEDAIYKWLHKSEFTKKKIEVDGSRDVTYTGMTGIIRIGLKHFEPTVRDAARHISNLLDNYSGLTRMGYDAETTAIDSILARLFSDGYMPAVELTGILPWANRLQSLNGLFKTFVDDMAQEQLGKPNLSPKAARHETDEALRPITNRVTALIDLNGPEAYIPFADEFNVLVKHYNTLVHEHYGRLHAKTDIAPAVIDAIATQAFTGQPVFVIPTVGLPGTDRDSVGKVVSLVFTRDFTVTYRNNINPGTATLVIHGVGKYKGEVTTTFNIER